MSVKDGRCPVCGEECVDAGSITVDGTECSQRCWCENGHEWWDIYTLTEQEEVVG